MNGDSHFIEIALKIEPGLLDEVFVIGIVADLLQGGKNIGQTQRCQVHVRHRVRFWQQPDGFGRSMQSHPEEHSHGSDRNDHGQQC